MSKCGFHSFSDIYKFWAKQRSYLNYAETIQPNVNIINISVAYELGVLKVYLEPIFRRTSVESPYYHLCKEYLEILSHFMTIPPEYVPKSSALYDIISPERIQL